MIAQLILDDPSKIQKSEICLERFPDQFRRNCNGQRSDQVVARSLDALRSVLSGFQLPESKAESIIEEYIRDLRQALDDPALPLVEVRDVLSKLSGRIPAVLEENVKVSPCMQPIFTLAQEHLLSYERSLGSMFSSFPAAEIAKGIKDQEEAFPASQAFEKTTFLSKVAPLTEVITKYDHSLKYAISLPTILTV